MGSTMGGLSNSRQEVMEFMSWGTYLHVLYGFDPIISTTRSTCNHVVNMFVD